MHSVSLFSPCSRISTTPSRYVQGHMTTSGLEVKFRTNQLEHEFGRPYQIGHHEYASRAEDADLVSFFVCRGDIIVMGR